LLPTIALGFKPQVIGQCFDMVLEIDTAEIALMQIAFDTAAVVEQPRLATETQTIETGKNESDQRPETC